MKPADKSSDSLSPQSRTTGPSARCLFVGLAMKCSSSSLSYTGFALFSTSMSSSSSKSLLLRKIDETSDSDVGIRDSLKADHSSTFSETGSLVCVSVLGFRAESLGFVV